MADKKISELILLIAGQMTATAKIPVANPGAPTADGSYAIQFDELVQAILTALKAEGVPVVISGTYTSDALAQSSGGGVVGEYYRLAPGNVYGFPSDGGVLKRIQS